MANVADVRDLAMALSEPERAALAVQLLESLPPVLADHDEGVTEALRRDAELQANPALGLSVQDLDDACLHPRNRCG